MVYGMPITDSRTTYMFTEPSLNPDSDDEPSYVFADDHDAVLEMIDLDTLENAVQQAVEGYLMNSAKPINEQWRKELRKILSALSQRWGLEDYQAIYFLAP